MTMCDEPRDIVFALQSIAEPLTRCVVDYQIAPCDLFWQVILADTERNLMEHQATNLQKVLKTSWDDITSSVDCMAASRSRRPCIRVKLSRKYPRVGHPTSEVPELDGEANDTRLVAFQSDHYGEEYQGSGAFHLLYGTMEDDDMCLIVEYGCDVLIITRTTENDSFKLCGLALQVDAEMAERELKVLEKLWDSGIEVVHGQASDGHSYPLDIRVCVSPLALGRSTSHRQAYWG